MRILLTALALLLAPGLAAGQGALTRLDTGDKNRGWEAVGRLELAGLGFCTGVLIAPDLVLTAAHCLYDKATGARLDHETVEFLAGWRNGRASAYRQVERAVLHPGYAYGGPLEATHVRNDVALLKLRRPIHNARVAPFATDRRPERGQRVGVVSYARGRANVPSLQEVCEVMALQEGVLVTSCDVDYGSSGAPIFTFGGGAPRVVSVVSAMAEVAGEKVALGTGLKGLLEVLKARLAAGMGGQTGAGPDMAKVGHRHDTGAKFAKP